MASGKKRSLFLITHALLLNGKSARLRIVCVWAGAALPRGDGAALLGGDGANDDFVGSSGQKTT